MKKTLLALAVLAAAGSAQAIELYNQDGVTVNLKGDIEVRYKKSTTKDDNLKQEIDDADLGIDTRYQVNDDLQIGGYIEYSGDSSDRAQGTVANGNTYVGFYSNSMGTLKVGRLDTQLDDAGIGSDYLFGIDSYFGDLPTGGEEAVRYDLDLGTVYFGAGWIQDHYEQKKSTRDHHYDLKLGARVADFDFTAFYGEAAIEGTNDKDKIAAIEARFGGIENLNLEVGYYNTDEAGDGEADTFGFAADYSVSSWTFAAGVSSTDVKDDEDFTAWFVNAGYGIAPNTTLYAEVGGNDAINDDTGLKNETGYGFGIKATF